MARSFIWACAALALIGCTDAQGPAAVQEAGQQARPGIREDPRVEALLYDCAKEEYFGEDTSNLIPALVAKLSAGQRDPLRGAKRDLALFGEAALDELSRAVDSELAGLANANVLQSILGTIALMPPPHGREIAWRLLDHPQEGVRIAALRALSGRCLPSDFDRLLEFVPVASLQLKAACIAPLFESDPARFVAQYEQWVESETQGEIWPHSVLLIAAQTEFAPQAKRITAILRDKKHPYALESLARLNGLLASTGDEEAIAALLDLRDSEVSSNQYYAAEALAAAGLGGELRSVLRSSSDTKLRTIAAEAIGNLPPEKQWDDALSLGLSDEDEGVRKTCLTHLLVRKDEAARDFALSLLLSSSSDRQLALDALAGPLKTDRGLALEVFELLKEQLANESAVYARVPLFQSLGQLPLAEAARFLLERADLESGPIEGLDPHRWIAMQAGNTGVEGTAVVFDAWRSESDPVRRLDLLDSLFSGRSPEVLARMSEAVTRSDVTPFEVLAAADYLTRMGPAQACAPLLKRVALRCNEAGVRRALQCLLWRFYGS